MPKAGGQISEGPFDIVPCHTLADAHIVGNIHLIVEVEKFMMLYWPIDKYNRHRYEQHNPGYL